MFKSKKRKYQQMVLDVEMGTFTPLVFGTNGGMEVDCNCFLKRPAEKLSHEKEWGTLLHFYYLDWKIAFFWDFKVGTHA